MFRWSLSLVVAAMLAGCDAFGTLTEGLQQARAVEADLAQSTGVKPAVGFNWHNGRLTSVTVEFPRLYADKPLGDLAGLVREAVARDFRQTPGKIVLSFAIENETPATSDGVSVRSWCECAGLNRLLPL
jgi:hypothetical protein